MSEGQRWTAEDGEEDSEEDGEEDGEVGELSSPSSAASVSN